MGEISLFGTSDRRTSKRHGMVRWTRVGPHYTSWSLGFNLLWKRVHLINWKADRS